MNILLFFQETYILHILSSIQKKRSLKRLKMGMPCPANEFILRKHIFKCVATSQESEEFYHIKKVFPNLQTFIHLQDI